MKLVPDIFTSKYSKPINSLLSNRAPYAELRDGEQLWDPSVNILQLGNSAPIFQTQK